MPDARDTQLKVFLSSISVDCPGGILSIDGSDLVYTLIPHGDTVKYDCPITHTGTIELTCDAATINDNDGCTLSNKI